MSDEVVSQVSSEAPSSETPTMPPSGEVGAVEASASSPTPVESSVEATSDSGSTEASALPQAVLDQAKSYGLDESMVKSLSSDAAVQLVRSFALAYDQRIAALGREASPAQLPPTVPAAQQVQSGAGKQEVPAMPQTPGEFRLEVPEDFDEDIKKAFGAASGKLGEHDKALKEVLSKVQSMYQHFEGARREAAIATFDRMCAEVDDGLKPLVGKGNCYELKAGTAERKFREDLLAQMDALDIGYRKQGVKLEEGEVFKRALNILSAPHTQRLERERLVKEVDGKKRGALHNPKTSTPKSSAGKTSREVEADSLAEVANLMVEHGLADKASLNVFASM